MEQFEGKDDGLYTNLTDYLRLGDFVEISPGLRVRAKIPMQIALDYEHKMQEWVNEGFPPFFFQLVEFDMMDVHGNVMAKEVMFLGKAFGDTPSQIADEDQNG